MEINFFKYATPKRLWNILKVIVSYRLSVLLKRPIVWGMPISYSVEPTNYCNLKCPECPSGTGELTRPLGSIDLNSFKTIIDQISSTGFYVQLFFQGEPYVNKELPSLIDYAKSQNVYTSVSTNGILFNDKKIDEIISNAPDKIIFSIDGLDETTYQNYRVGGTFKEADNGLKRLIDAKNSKGLKSPFIELQFIVMKQNEHQIEAVQEYGKTLGVDKVVLKTMQVNSVESAKFFLPENKEYSRYNIEDDKLVIKNKMLNKCFALWKTSVITWDGKISPCCFDKDVKYEIGNLTDSSIKDIWTNKNFMNFRKGILNNRSAIDICRNCTEGQKININEV